MPPFGITNTVWDLTNYTYNFGTGEVAYPIGPNGPYTHYVDANHPNASDTLPGGGYNYGTPARPRRGGVDVTSAAEVRPQGNIIEVHSDAKANYSIFWARAVWTNNSAARPSYIRGGSYANRPMLDFADHRFAGHYVIIENFCFTNSGYGGTIAIAGKYGTPPSHVSHIVIRSNEFASYGGNLGNGAVIGIGDTDTTSLTVSNCVVFGNWIHHHGDTNQVGSSRVDLQACKLEYSIVSPK